jgi:hypothetical protein
VVFYPTEKRSAKGLYAGALSVVFVAPFLVFIGLVLLFALIALAGAISTSAAPRCMPFHGYPSAGIASNLFQQGPALEFRYWQSIASRELC